LKIKALWLVLFVFDPKQREFQSYNAICAAGSVTEEMPDQKRIVFEHRAVICRQEKSWLAGNRSFFVSAVTGRIRKYAMQGGCVK
jgi:hypothetical protein